MFPYCHADGMKPSSERLLRFVLRYIGAVSLLALVAVIMPHSWMDATHRWLGMGPLPAEPIVGYLARSLSLFYAFLGGLLWVCSFDLLRHRPVLCYLGAAFIVFGLVMWGVDFAEKMPNYWKHFEGPMVAVFGVIILGLSVRLKSAQPTERSVP
jgi:NADH:ubiquinone oxidoreductase subunit 6 (subunit J)